MEPLCMLFGIIKHSTLKRTLSLGLMVVLIHLLTLVEPGIGHER